MGERWVDESGKTVIIDGFFSALYQDEESKQLSQMFPLWRHHQGDYQGGFFGKAEIESLVNKLLALIAFAHNNIVGVSIDELRQFAELDGEHFYIATLLNDGYLREKLVAGKLVVFPTQGMLEQFRFQ